MPPRRSRGRTSAVTPRRTSSRFAALPSDDEMPDVDPQASQDDADNEEAATTPAQISDNDAEQSNPPTPQSIQLIPRKRRGPGRPPRNPRPEMTPEPGVEDGSESATPFKRKRGRPVTTGAGVGRTGFRGRLKKGPAGPSHVTRVPIDKEGNMMDVVDDEVAIPPLPEGDEKVDPNGNLLQGREYRVRTFTLKGRGEKLYMLSTEPARCIGFRDSYLFFAKHPLLFKIIIGDEEKRDLIERDLMPHSYKGRAIGVVTARSVFREFGAKIIVGGKHIIDDYNEPKARAEGFVEGELADPNDTLPTTGEEYNRNRYVAWHGASSVYHTNQPSVPTPLGRPLTGKRKGVITSANWMLEHAREASRFNSTLAEMRKAACDGVYDPHTNAVCYPRTMQPTHAKWERAPPNKDPTSHSSATLLNGTSATHVNGINGTAQMNGPTTVDYYTSYPSVPPVVSRNFLIIDTIMEAPPHDSFADPGPDQAYSLHGPPGLPKLGEDDVAELPEEERVAFRRVKALEEEWKARWGPQGVYARRSMTALLGNRRTA